jgi:hypothetical protein
MKEIIIYKIFLGGQSIFDLKKSKFICKGEKS